METKNNTITISKNEFLKICGEALQENTKDFEKLDIVSHLFVTCVIANVLSDITTKLFNKKRKEKINGI